MSLLEIKKSDVTANAIDEYKDDKDFNKKLLNDKNNNNNSTTDQPQIILQTDEIITVVVSENSSSNKITREVVNDDDGDEKTSESDKNLLPKSILTNNNKSLLRKKSVSFETSEDVKKFIEGEEIIDKKNPFRSNLIIDGDSNNSDKYRIIKGKKSSKVTAPLASEETDFITKEEILKQSKFVPVYIKHPDKVLTYPKPVLEKIKTPSENHSSNRRIPVPLPRGKSSQITTSSKSDKKEKKKSRVRNPNYPDLSDIKVKTGTDIDESLYDPNEVVLNVKKFDSRFKKLQFGSTDDLEEIVDREETSITVNGGTSSGGGENKEKEDNYETTAEVKSDEKKSYTNTVNSEEFRQYLKKKGLLLFPIKTNGESNGSAKISIDEIDNSNMDDRNAKRKSVFSRLSSIFSKGKTMPKTNEPLSRISYTNKSTDNGNLGSNIKRVILERNSSDNRSVSANSEFMQHFSSLDINKHHRSSDEDNKSSISSVLTAAADDDDHDGGVDTPVIVRRNNIHNGYRHIDLNKSKLYQSKVRQNNNQEDIIKPKVQRPQSMPQHQQQQVTKSLIKPPVPLRRSTERQTMPAMMRRTMKVENSSSIPRMANNNVNNSDKIKNNTSTPNGHHSLKSLTLSPIPAPRPQQPASEIDPITFAKIHEIKKKTDEVLLNKSSLQNNLRFSRNSPQRSTMTEVYQNRLTETPQLINNQIINNSVIMRPPRSQSVLDNMTMFKNSLYGEVTYRRPDGSNVNVIMRRPESSTMDRNQVMQKIYEYYRKSVNNTPVPFQRNLHYKSQSTDTSPVSYASINTRNNAKYYSRPSTLSSVKSDISRNHTISETDSVFLHPENEGSGSNFGNHQQQKQQQRRLYAEPDRIYDVVYGENSNNGTYGNINRSQRPASAMGGSLLLQQQNRHAMGRMTPLILQQPQQFVMTTTAGRQGDIIINNQIYRPISTIPNTTMMSPPKMKSSLPQPLPQQIKPQPIYSTPTRRRTTTSYESDSEAGEIQSIMERKYEEDYQNEKSSRNQQNEQVVDDRRRSSGRREDPRRHTLGPDMMHYANQGGVMQRSMDLEMGQPQKSRKGGMPIRAYTPQHQGPLFDDDPGIMSEVETASTGFRRGLKSRSSLPVVRTPSKTLERPLGLVFLQYRSETKRALLPNEITSIDTVRALFVRSFPRQLTMAYLEGPNVKIYIHDSSKDMFYELEDVRSHLREIRDRSVLRLFESNEVAAPQVLPGGPNIPQPLPQQGHWDQDPSYFSEPEFDSEYQHQHIHKSKTGKAAPYYVGSAQTLPRGHVYTDRSKGSIGVPAKPISRSYGSRGNMQFSYPTDQLYSIPDGYMSSPERGTRAYEEPYYTQYGTRGSSVTPIIDEEQSDSMLIDDQYALYGGMKRISRNPNQMYDPSRPEDLHRFRVEHMERQLANLTGLVQKALVQNPQITGGIQQQQQQFISNVPGSGGQYRNDKSVSFEKSVSFSDDIQGVSKAHSPQHMADTKPTKPAIKSSTLPRTSSQERDRLKPVPPLAANQYQHLTLAPEVYNHLRGLQKKTKDLKSEVKTLRRLAQSQAIAVREDIKDTFMRIRATLLATSGTHWGQNDQERTRISREEEIYKQEVIRLEKDLADLEGSVEVLRGEVINRRTRVNMAAVEDMALILSRASKTVAELKMRFPNLQQNLRNILSSEMDRVCREEKFLKEEPDRLEIALRRCKKLTGTLVTLKRLASVQEQRTCVDTTLSAEESSPRSASETANNTNKPIPSPRMGSGSSIGGIAPENALDALLDELQTFAKPPNHDQQQLRPDESTASDESSHTLQNTVTTKLSQSQLYPESAHQLRRLHSYPSGSDTEESPPRPPLSTKPPVPERNSELARGVKGKKVPPPPPPRTSSRSPLASPTSPNVNSRLLEQNLADQYAVNNMLNNNNNNNNNDGDSGSESANSQDNNSQRQLQLEMRHQELLKKQKALQEQYQRLQQMSAQAIPLSHNVGDGSQLNSSSTADKVNDNVVAQPQTTVTTNKVYETDIL